MSRIITQSETAPGLDVMQAPRIKELDAFRGLLALGVMFFHLYPQGLFWLWSCVDGFFVLSGFVITRLLMSTSLDAKGLISFYARRALRIWPVYYLTLLAALTLHVGYSIKNGEPLGGISGGPQSFLFLQHVQFYWQSIQDYIDLNYIRWFGHSWSLAVEEQFYWLWPLVIILWRNRIGCLLTACVLLLATSVWLRHAGFLVFILGARADGLALGSLMAFTEIWLLTSPEAHAKWYRKFKIIFPAVALISVAAALPLYIVPGYLSNQVDKLYLVDSTWVVLVFAALFFGVVGTLWIQSSTRWVRLFRSPVLLWLGGRSYAIYMFHPLVQAMLERVVSHANLPEITLTIGTVGCTLALAHLSCVYIERWFAGLRPRFPLHAA